MKRLTLISMTAALAVASALLFSRPLRAQVSGGTPAFVRLQAQTPGAPQSGHSNITGTAIAGLFQGDGSALTGLNASNIASGLLADARLSSNIPRKNAANSFGAFDNTFAGKVGVGTMTPLAKLDVAGDAVFTGLAPHELGMFNNTVEAFDIGLAGGPGHYSASATTNDVVLRNIVPGKAIHLQNGLGSAALTVAGNNSIGIGTATPAAKLEVRGDVRMGSAGQFFASSGEENLRIVRGVVTAQGAALAGAGWNMTRPSTGHYDLTFQTPFAGIPAVTASADDTTAEGFVVAVTAVTSSSVRFIVTQTDVADWANKPFHFIAIGPR